MTFLNFKNLLDINLFFSLFFIIYFSYIFFNFKLSFEN